MKEKRFEKNEIRLHEWRTLASLWRRIRPAAETAQSKAVEAFIKLTDTALGDLNWDTVNQTEMMVGEYLTDAVLKTEFENLLYIAKTRATDFQEEFRQKLPLFDDLSTDGALEMAKSVYFSLLYRLQSDFITTRFNRQLRRETSLRLIWTGVVVIAICMLPMLLTLPIPFKMDQATLASRLSLTEPYFAIVMTLCFGILGSYFSRILNFHSIINNFGFETADALYSVRQLILRLMFGMIAAGILYFLVWSGLIGGDLFPALDKNFTSLDLSRFPAKADKGPDLIEFLFLKPNTDLAKLIVWAFIAGFSERFVPESISRLEGKVASEEG